MLQIKVFERGGRPLFWDWLKSLRDMQARARIRTRLDRLAMGNWGDHRALGGGVIELKIDWGAGLPRVCGQDRQHTRLAAVWWR